MSGAIKVLPQHVANRIAAGEVVERPLGVVRELVDNAIDAGAKQVTIEVARGGKELVRVNDDGSGMQSSDVPLAFQRHATSKLRSAEELAAISTLGFRGEALAAIASVSRVRLRSRQLKSELGYEIVLSAGTVMQESECAAPSGTLVEVHDLFFNAPARQKFLRSDRSEELRIRGHLLQMSLAHPDVSFRYISDQREVFSLAARDSMLERARGMYKGSLVEFTESAKFGLDGSTTGAAQICLSGLIGHPALAHSKVDSFVTIVNGRVITDRTILRAVREGFESTLKPREFPVGVLSIQLPCELVDVNVHPQKSEVRFVQSQALFLAVRSAVRRAVHKFSAPVAGSEMTRPSASVTSGVAASVGGLRFAGAAQLSLGEASTELNLSSATDLSAESVVSEFRFSHLRYRGQIFECYLLCEAPDKLVIVDMHAAHERYNFNLVRNRFRESQIVTQPLLIPLEISLAPLALERCREHAGALAQLGFELDFISEEILKLRAIPALLTDARDLAGLFRELALSDLEGAASVEQRLDAIAARIACHASIRSGKAMTNEEVEALFASLDSTAFSAACPHGRPVVIEFSINEVERWFGRDR